MENRKFIEKYAIENEEDEPFVEISEAELLATLTSLSPLRQLYHPRRDPRDRNPWIMMGERSVADQKVPNPNIGYI